MSKKKKELKSRVEGEGRGRRRTRNYVCMYFRVDVKEGKVKGKKGRHRYLSDGTM